MLATHPAPGRAEVEKAVEEYSRLTHLEASGFHSYQGQRLAARAALLALYAEPVGEEQYTTQAIMDNWPNCIVALSNKFAPGQRVRVVRVAEGATS